MTKMKMKMTTTMVMVLIQVRRSSSKDVEEAMAGGLNKVFFYYFGRLKKV